jgi:hypothetical protein
VPPSAHSNNGSTSSSAASPSAAAQAGSYARPSCSSTYCHGNFSGGAGAARLVTGSGNAPARAATARLRGRRARPCTTRRTRTAARAIPATAPPR